jgi:putative oxidoreductase
MFTVTQRFYSTAMTAGSFPLRDSKTLPRIPARPGCDTEHAPINGLAQPPEPPRGSTDGAATVQPRAAATCWSLASELASDITRSRMADELKVNPGTRFDRVGHSGTYPASGPRPPGEALIRGQGELTQPEERHRVSESWRSWPGNSAMLAIGRAIFGGYFLYNGINHFVNRGMLTEYARSKRVPAANAAVPASGALILLGGLSVMTGVQPKIGASLIATFLLGVSPRMHDFWRIDDQERRMHEFVNFTKNMALVGSACLVAALPEPWPASVQARTAG